MSQHNRDKTTCPQGHQYTPTNTYTTGGRRYCRPCRRAFDRRRRRVVQPEPWLTRWLAEREAALGLEGAA